MLITATVPTWWCPPSSSAPPRDPRRSRTGPWRRCRSGSGPRSSSGSCSSGSSSLTTLLLRQWFSVVPWRWRSWTTPWRRCRFSGSSRSSSGRCGWCRSCSAPSRPSPLLSGTSYMSLLLDKRFFTWCIATANEQRSFLLFLIYLLLEPWIMTLLQHQELHHLTQKDEDYLFPDLVRLALWMMPLESLPEVQDRHVVDVQPVLAWSPIGTVFWTRTIKIFVTIPCVRSSGSSSAESQ